MEPLYTQEQIEKIASEYAEWCSDSKKALAWLKEHAIPKETPDA